MRKMWNVSSILKYVGLFLLSASCYAGNVILITLDGVRPMEAMNPKLMPFLNSFGKMSTAKVNNKARMSLAGYQNIFLGYPTDCMNNRCGGVSGTFPEELVDVYGKRKVIGIANWRKLDRAFGNAYLETGWSDDDVFRRGTYLYLTEKPKFLYLSVLDSDTYAHLCMGSAVEKTLQSYDSAIMNLASKIYRDTAIVVTTDHGRGSGSEWCHHGKNVKGSDDIWVWSFGIDGSFTDHSSIKPLILNHINKENL